MLMQQPLLADCLCTCVFQVYPVYSFDGVTSVLSYPSELNVPLMPDVTNNAFQCLVFCSTGPLYLGLSQASRPVWMKEMSGTHDQGMLHHDPKQVMMQCQSNEMV